MCIFKQYILVGSDGYRKNRFYPPSQKTMTLAVGLHCLEKREGS